MKKVANVKKRQRHEGKRGSLPFMLWDVDVAPSRAVEGLEGDSALEDGDFFVAVALLVDALARGDVKHLGYKAL